MKDYKVKLFPKTRIATNDVCAIGLQKHNVVAMIEVDVTESREQIRQLKRDQIRTSFTAWLIKTIASTIKEYEGVAGYLKGKRKAVIFDQVNVSIVVEKEIEGQRVPIPLIIERANERTVESITLQIHEARSRNMSDKDLVLHRQSNRLERLYYHLPGFVRRLFWKGLLKHPTAAYRKMGNVAFTSVGMIGNVNGWFVPISVHPICFGMGKITKKPQVINDQIVIREMMNMTILMDHDVVDGGMMARFISRLSEQLKGYKMMNIVK